MQSLLVKYLLPTIALGMLSFGYYHVWSSEPSAEKLTPPTKPARSPYNKTVAAAGLIEAASENIAIGAAIPGLVLDVYYTSSSVGTVVQKGTPLFHVDDRHLKAQLKFQQASLAVAVAQLGKLKAMPRLEELPSAEAKVRSADANTKMMKDLADRGAALKELKSIAIEEAMQRDFNADIARAQAEQAKGDLNLLRAGAWKPDLDVARANVELAEAQIEQTRTEIERATVRAPIDGHLLQVTIRAGEYVSAQPGQTLMMMGDLSKYHVRVDVDEHDIPRFQTGATAKAFVRGPGRQELRLSFVRVERYVTPKKSLTGDNTERVDTRVLQAIYAIESAPIPIFVGQQLDVFIASNDD